MKITTRTYLFIQGGIILLGVAFLVWLISCSSLTSETLTPPEKHPTVQQITVVLTNGEKFICCPCAIFGGSSKILLRGYGVFKYFEHDEVEYVLVEGVKRCPKKHD